MKVARDDDEVEARRRAFSVDVGQSFEGVVHIFQGVGGFCLDDNVVFGDTISQKLFFEGFGLGEVAAFCEGADAARDDNLVGNSLFVEAGADFDATFCAAENEGVGFKVGCPVVRKRLFVAHKNSASVEVFQGWGTNANQEFENAFGYGIE